MTSSSVTTQSGSKAAGKQAPPYFRSKTLTAGLAFLFGYIGLHRFYLYGMRDKYGWAHIVGIVLGAFGYLLLAQTERASILGWVLSFPGAASLLAAFLSAIVYGLRPDAKWDAQFYACSLPGGDDFIAELTTPGEGAAGYAFGLQIGAYRGARAIQHGGSWGGYRAQLLRFPDLRTSVAVLANLATIDASGLAQQVAGVVLDGRLEPLPEAAAVEDGQAALGELAGVYVDADRTLIVELTETAARVQGNEFAVVRRSDGTFIAARMAAGCS